MNVIARLHVGPSRHATRGGAVKFSYYAGGDTALLVVDDQGDTVYVASVNLPGHDTPDRHHVWLKGWSENEGVPQALEAAGVVTLLPVFQPTGFVTAQLARLTPAAIAQLEMEVHS